MSQNIEINSNLRTEEPYASVSSLQNDASETLSKVNQFADSIGISIPSEIIAKRDLHDRGYFFSSDGNFYGGMSELQFANLFKSGKQILAFGQSGHGFNSYEFNIFYTCSKFGYFFKTSFGGAFTDNKKQAGVITNAFAALKNFIKNNNLDDAKQYILLDYGNKKIEGCILDKDKDAATPQSIAQSLHPIEIEQFYES